jgi:protease PrsW
MADTLSTLILAILASVLPTIVYVTLLWWLDRYEKEPAWLFTLAFLWGAVPGVVISLLFEIFLRAPLRGLAGGAGPLLETSGAAPLIEEGAKALALLAIFLLYRREFDGVLDGIIYGGVVGFGFAMSENILHFVSGLQKGGLASLGLLFGMRVVIFGLNHALFTAVTGVGFGAARLARRRWQRWLWPLLAWVVAVALHATHNLFAALAQVTCWSLLGSLFSDWAGLLVLLAVLILAWRQERRWVVNQLKSEVDDGVVLAQEYAVLTSWWRRMGYVWQGLLAEGIGGALARRRRLNWATELAFKKQQMTAVGEGQITAQLIDKLRARLTTTG